MDLEVTLLSYCIASFLSGYCHSDVKDDYFEPTFYTILFQLWNSYPKLDAELFAEYRQRIFFCEILLQCAPNCTSHVS